MLKIKNDFYAKYLDTDGRFWEVKKGYALALLRYALGIDENRLSALKGISTMMEFLS